MNIPEEPKNKKCIYPEGYKQHYKDSKYFLNYYHTNKHLIECPNCHKQTNNTHIREHQRSKKCMNYMKETDKFNKLNEVIDVNDNEEIKLLLRQINQIKYEKKKLATIIH